jgi:uncharacterized protein YbjT (DUF2867 family)
MKPSPLVLVVGGTGFLGRQVVSTLQERGARVRLLVRPGSGAPNGPEIIRGDMMEPATLDAAFAGVDVVISTAAGYTKRRRSDSLATDRIGNENLALAARRSGVSRFVLLSIIGCDHAEKVPHFWAKALAETALRDAKVPFVAVRAGGFLDQSKDFLATSVAKNKFMGIGDLSTSRWTYNYTPDLAESLVAAALTENAVEGHIIDVGWSDGPVSNQQLAKTVADQTGRKLKTSLVSWAMITAASATIGRVNRNLGDLFQMFLFFRSGHYIADNRAHEELLGPLPSRDDAVKRWASANSLIV